MSGQLKRSLCGLALLVLTLLASRLALASPLDDEPDEATLRSNGTPVHYTCTIVNTYPHDPKAFTQGLIYSDGRLFESTGLYYQSSLREVELETGNVVRSHLLPGFNFGEGLTRWRGHLLQLTWQSHFGFVYDVHSFEQVNTFKYRGEGWGLTHNGTSLILSDGTPRLRFLDPSTFAVTRHLDVHDGATPIDKLNELEFVRGLIYANIWYMDSIAMISPDTGKVVGWIDLSSLRQALAPYQGAEALNGIAYDHENHRLFVTGKLWPKLFEIKLVRNF